MIHNIPFLSSFNTIHFINVYESSFQHNFLLTIFQFMAFEVGEFH